MRIRLYDKFAYLPSAEELPDSDDTPVDNELQYLIPYLAHKILFRIWGDRDDWFWVGNMGIYYHPEKPPLVPNAFLNLGVQGIKSTGLRPSYVLWEEAGIVRSRREKISDDRGVGTATTATGRSGTTKGRSTGRISAIARHRSR